MGLRLIAETCKLARNQRLISMTVGHCVIHAVYSQNIPNKICHYVVTHFIYRFTHKKTLTTQNTNRLIMMPYENMNIF